MTESTTHDLVARIVRQLDVARTIPSIPVRLRERAADAAVDYIVNDERFSNIAVHLHNVGALRAGLDAVSLQGLVAEFGVYKGDSLKVIAKHFPDQVVHGFDSFEGLPTAWGGTSKVKGDFDTGGTPPALDVTNTQFHVGWFDDTVPAFAKESHGPFAFVHIDSDIYESAKTVFDHLGRRFVPSTVIVFDEYFGFHGWQNHEHRAFMDFLARSGLDFDAIAIGHMNLAVRLR